MSLPSGYNQLEYIQSTGTQYIDTGFKPNQNTRVVMEMEFPIAPTSDRILCGVRAGSWGDRMFTITYVNSKSWWQFTYGSSYSTTSVTASINTRFSVDQNKNVGTVNGVSSSATANTFTSSLNAFIFCQNNGGSASNFSSFRLFRFSMYDNGTLVRDFIPCQKPDGTLGLWDDVNSVFYGNAGTGTFTAGPVVDLYGNDEHTLLLLHGEDLADSSPYGVSITNNGVTVSNIKSKFGGKSLLFNRGNYLTIPAINFGSNDFTVDWWEYVSDDTAGTRFSTVFASSYQTGAGGILAGCYEGASKIYVSSKTSFQWDLVSSQTCFNNNALNSWVHRAIVRDGSSLKIFTNGTLERTYGIGTSAIGYNANSPFCIGKWVSDYDPSGYLFCGYIDEFRISNIARWTEDFTPPTEPYTSSLNLPVNIGGTWKDANEAFVNIGGTWKTVKDAFVNIDGVWKKIG